MILRILEDQPYFLAKLMNIIALLRKFTAIKIYLPFLNLVESVEMLD